MHTASLPPFIGWFVEADTINMLVSNKVEVPLTEMKCLVIGSYVFPIREVFKKCKSGVFNHLGGEGGYIHKGNILYLVENNGKKNFK